MINTDIYLAILGYGTECSKKNAAIAKSIGKMAAKNDISLVAGNVSSTFGFAFKTSSENSGNNICVIEKHKKVGKDHDADQVIRTKDTYHKHKQIAQIADAAVLIGGGAGSQLLLKYFLKNNKTVIAIKGSGGLADTDLPKQVLIANNAREAFQLLNSIKTQCSFKTELGNIQLHYDHFALIAVHLTEKESEINCHSKYDFVQQFQQYLKNNLREFDGKVHLKGTNFQKRVWKALLDIPYGNTLAYGELAEQLGDKKASRAVGHAAGQNPIWVIIPCHRLVGKSGSLTGYAGGLEMKMRLLDLEKQQTELDLF